MKIITWALRLAIFLFLFVFAVQNTEPVTLRFLLGSAWQAPLVILLLAFFAAGALLGVLSLLGLVYRQRREISRLKREIAKPEAAEIVVPPPLV